MGLFLSASLASKGLRVAVLEAGQFRGDQKSMLAGSSVNPGGHIGIDKGWTTGPGGTTQLWGGQLWPWRGQEFEARDDVGIDAWPIPAHDVTDNYPDVRRILGISDPHDLIHRTSHELGPDLEVRFSTWLPWRKRNFARNPRLSRPWAKPGKVSHFTGFRVEAVSADPSPAVHFLNGTGELGSLSADAVVIAAGTLGNTRILQNSLPGQSWIGEGIMDHVSARYATYIVHDWPKFRAFASHRRWRGVLASPRIVPSTEFLKANSILPSYGHWEFELSEDSALGRLRQLARAAQMRGHFPGFVDLFRSVLRDLPETIESVAAGFLHRRRPIPKSSKIHLRIDVQQPARSSSRLNWQEKSEGSATGVLGAGAHLAFDWHVGDEEVQAAKVFGAHIARVLSAVDIGAVASRIEPELHFTDTFHLMGGTRMGGVGVDSDLQVRALPGVFVTGLSVFPTGGMANPTYTALALSNRLASYLAARRR